MGHSNLTDYYPQVSSDGVRKVKCHYCQQFIIVIDDKLQPHGECEGSSRMYYNMYGERSVQEK